MHDDARRVHLVSRTARTLKDMTAMLDGGQRWVQRSQCVNVHGLSTKLQGKIRDRRDADISFYRSEKTDNDLP